MTRLTKKGVKFEWSRDAQHAWQTIKDNLVNSPILKHPDLDKRFTIICDASAYAVGCILTQEGDDGFLHAVSYGSAVLSETQRKWSTVQRELYALVHFCDKYHTFLLNNEFTVITDNIMQSSLSQTGTV